MIRFKAIVDKDGDLQRTFSHGDPAGGQGVERILLTLEETYPEHAPFRVVELAEIGPAHSPSGLNRFLYFRIPVDRIKPLGHDGAMERPYALRAEPDGELLVNAGTVTEILNAINNPGQ